MSEEKSQTTQLSQSSPHEGSVLPSWLYPLCFWLALPVLLLSLWLPQWASLGIWYMMAVPAIAALMVVIKQYKSDPQVSQAALIALGGLALVIFVKQFILSR